MLTALSLSPRSQASPRRLAAQRVLRHVDPWQLAALDDPRLAHRYGDSPDQRAAHLQAEEAERAGSVGLLIQVALALLNRAEHAVLAGACHATTAMLLVARRQSAAAEDDPRGSDPAHAPLTDRHGHAFGPRRHVGGYPTPVDLTE